MDIVDKILTKIEFIEKTKPELAAMYMRVAEKCDECLKNMDDEEKQRGLIAKAFEKVELYVNLGNEEQALKFIDIARRAALTFKTNRLIK